MPARKGGHEVFCGNWENGVDKRCDERYNLSCVCGRSSSGRARPCQGRGSEFEPRRPLQKETPSVRMVFSFWNVAGRMELAASTGAKRVKSRGEGRAPANGSAIRGMPGSEFEPRLFCYAKVVACGRVIEREWGNPQRFPPHTPPSLRWAGVQTTKPVDNHKKKHHPDRMVFLFGMPRAGWNSLPRPVRISGRTAAGFRVGRPALRPPPFIAGAFVCRAANRSVGDGVPDVPSARRCRAGNGFPRRFAPRSKCPWGTPRNDRGVGLSTRCHHPTGWCFFSYNARRNSGFRSRRPSSAAAICPSRASRSPLRVPFSVR